MISKKLVQSTTMFNGFSSCRPAIDVPVDAGDDGVVATASAQTLRIDSRCVVVIFDLVRGSIVLFDGLVGRMFGVIDVLAGVDAKMMAVTTTDLDFIVMWR